MYMLSVSNLYNCTILLKIDGPGARTSRTDQETTRVGEISETGAEETSEMGE